MVINGLRRVFEEYGVPYHTPPSTGGILVGLVDRIIPRALGRMKPATSRSRRWTEPKAIRMHINQRYSTGFLQVLNGSCFVKLMSLLEQWWVAPQIAPSQILPSTIQSTQEMAGVKDSKWQPPMSPNFSAHSYNTLRSYFDYDAS